MGRPLKSEITRLSELVIFACDKGVLASQDTRRHDLPVQELEWREAEEMEWGDLLRVSQRGLWASRRFLWDEAARNIAALLACPSAWDGDHFLQVPHPKTTQHVSDQLLQASGWAQRILANTASSDEGTQKTTDIKSRYPKRPAQT